VVLVMERMVSAMEMVSVMDETARVKRMGIGRLLTEILRWKVIVLVLTTENNVSIRSW
jgi:hypothetical protein